jgi:hypothetical protein
MGISRQFLLAQAKEKENEEWMSGLTSGNTRWKGEEIRSPAYLWGTCVRDALKARRVLCDFVYEYNFGSRDFQGLVNEATKRKLIGDKKL